MLRGTVSIDCTLAELMFMPDWLASLLVLMSLAVEVLPVLLLLLLPGMLLGVLVPAVAL
jgi:hypothetical protein